MALPEVSREDLIAAIHRFDSEFRNSSEWEDWENNRNHLYAIEFEGSRYPVKQIISLATTIPTSEFYGGVGTGQANECIQKAGLSIVELRRRNPPWSRDELILALDLYLRNRQSPPGADSEAVRDLSDLLNHLGRHLHSSRSDNYRNPNGVYMKLMNFRSLDPEHPNSSGLAHSGKGDGEIWAEFGSNPQRCFEAAAAIRAAIEDLETEPTDDSDFYDDGMVEASEGRAVTRVHQRRERNRKLVKRKKERVLKKLGKLECEACGFNFETGYGDRGSGYIECHHVRPVHDLKPGERTHIDDLALLCANCHRMVHAKRPWLTIDQLRNRPEVIVLRRLLAGS